MACCVVDTIGCEAACRLVGVVNHLTSTAQLGVVRQERVQNIADNDTVLDSKIVVLISVPNKYYCQSTPILLYIFYRSIFASIPLTRVYVYCMYL